MSCLVYSDLSKTFIRIVSNFIGKNSSGTIKFRAIPFELHNIQFHNAVFFGNNIVYSIVYSVQSLYILGYTTYCK